MLPGQGRQTPRETMENRRRSGVIAVAQPRHQILEGAVGGHGKPPSLRIASKYRIMAGQRGGRNGCSPDFPRIWIWLEKSWHSDEWFPHFLGSGPNAGPVIPTKRIGRRSPVLPPRCSAEPHPWSEKP
jgi:hypothetical protein